jgi:hypothetical protein
MAPPLVQIANVVIHWLSLFIHFFPQLKQRYCFNDNNEKPPVAIFIADNKQNKFGNGVTDTDLEID